VWLYCDDQKQANEKLTQDAKQKNMVIHRCMLFAGWKGRW